MRFNEILEGTRADIAVKVFGDDFAEIEKIAGEVREILEKVPGAADVEFDALGKAPLLEITPNREAMAKYNVHAAEINEAVENAMAGGEAGVIIDGNRRYPIVVRMPEDLRKRIDEMKKLPLRTSEGGLVTLGQVADFKVDEKVNSITREMGQRRAAIMVNLRGRDVESFVLEAQKKVAEQVKLPSGYTVEFGGQFKNLQEARARLGIIVPVALIVIFLLIFMAFGSLRQALLIYTGIPLAVTGGIFALWLRGMPFSITAGVGFIALSGVAVLNGLMMVSYFNQLREAGTIPAGCNHGRFSYPLAACDDDRPGRQSRLSADGSRQRRGRRGPAPARHGRHRRHHQLDVPHPRRAAHSLPGLRVSIWQARTQRKKRMKTLAVLIVFAVSALAESSVRSFTPEELVNLALSNNPELRFYEQQVAALPKASSAMSPIIPQPLDFPSRENFRRAVLNLDAELARFYLAEFRFALAGQVRLKAMEYQAAMETGVIASDLASRISTLVRMLEERPAAGVQALIERRILEGAALPFVRQAAEARRAHKSPSHRTQWIARTRAERRTERDGRLRASARDPGQAVLGFSAVENSRS